ncbi:MmgE/PrpD family protein [Halomarina halobia]|uniref:MmgE/PrpD family protein n=1 Tax=Halomarina halobia TaxID=3033386 RepID=A0ABD6AD28_9EURY|nr:MmgE/PrpD family protein [Halomarina sp. PSR21]
MAEPTDHERELASFVADLDPADVPERIRDRAGLVVADTVGAILGGASDPAVAGLVERWAGTPNGNGTATVLGTDDLGADPTKAAFVNGTSGTALELDEGHKYAAGHPAIHVLPAALAEAEADYGGGEAFLTAFVAGYEAAVRVARAATPLDARYHPHGVWGAVGAAAAVCRYRGFDPDETLTSLRIAANYAQHTRFAAATEGATVRNSFAGMSNLSGIVAADQAGAGFTGLSEGIARHLDAATDDGVDPAALSEGLGTDWELAEGYFKRHAACRFTHPALDAVAALDDAGSVPPPARIERVEVETYPAAAALAATRPGNALQAKFSVPFAVATALVTGGTGKEAFEESALTDETLALAERVSVRVADDIAERVPDARGARVRIRDRAGTTVSRTVEEARGGERDPFTEAELREKFEALAAPVVGDRRVDDLWAAAREPAAPRVLCALTRA